MMEVEEARRLYQGGDAAHDFDHVLRVLALAERIGAAEGADMAVVRAAALLHDVARAEELRTGRCHAQAGAELARRILAGQAPDKVEAVAQAIAAHRFRNDVVPQTLEAQVLYDADKLDAMGATGVARAYALAGRLGQRLWTAVPEGRSPTRHDLTAGHSPAMEFAVKLSRLKDVVYTPTAKRLAEERHRYMADFFARLEKEIQGQS